jgi:hypothetical protein
MTDERRQLRTKFDVALAHVARRAVEDYRQAKRTQARIVDYIERLTRAGHDMVHHHGRLAETTATVERLRAELQRLQAVVERLIEDAANAVVMQLQHVTAAAAQLVLRAEDLLPVMTDGPPCQPDRLVRALVAAPAAPPSSPDHGHINPVAGARRPLALT